jgi:hypothetical protein
MVFGSRMGKYLTYYSESPTPFVSSAQANDIRKKVERTRKQLGKVAKSHQLRLTTLA